ncbi:MAG: cupin domain-containing protein [Fulvivirga sp.]|nr:cupin domain-containing protein [Fulvivirga sp.]
MRYKVDNIQNHKDKRGWICGQFFPEGDILKTDNLEVKYSSFSPGETVPKHYHPVGEEVLIIIKGELKAVYDNEEYILRDGDFVYQKPETRETILEVLKPTFYVVVRTPSVPNNKVED